MTDERKDAAGTPDSRPGSPPTTSAGKTRSEDETAAALEELHATFDAQDRRRDALALAASVDPAAKPRR